MKIVNDNKPANICFIISRFDDTHAPRDVQKRLAEMAEVVKSTPKDLETQLRTMIHEPDYIPFHTTDDMYRTALPFLIDGYKLSIKNFATKDIQFYVIEKSSAKKYNALRDVMTDNPADLAKLKEREEKNAKRIANGKKPREYKPLRIRQIPTGEKRKVTITSISIFGIFNRYGLFHREDIGKVFGDNFKTCFAELILEDVLEDDKEDDNYRVAQNLKCGKTYTFDCEIRFKFNHYELKLEDESKPIEIKEKLPSIRDMLCRLSKPIDINQITKKDVGNYKIIHGIVKTSRTSVTKKDTMQGNLVLTSLDKNKVFKTVWWDNPLFATQFKPETEVYVICDITSHEKYGITGIGRFVVPLNDRTQVKASTKKEVNLNDWW